MKRRAGGKNIILLRCPIDEDTIKALKIGDQIALHGNIYCGRDAVLPKLVELFQQHRLDRVPVALKGSVIFHTAVSPAGIGPTTSNKVEIEGSMPLLSRAGVRIHLGKGALSPETVAALKKHNAVFAVTPPVSALFSKTILSQRVAAFKEEGMEALYELEVKGIPAIIAVAHGKTLFSDRREVEHAA